MRVHTYIYIGVSESGKGLIFHESKLGSNFPDIATRVPNGARIPSLPGNAGDEAGKPKVNI